jgi:AraC family transcriptional regulator
LIWSGRANAGRDPEEAVTVIIGGGRGAMLQADDFPSAIWIPLRGRVLLATADGTCSLAAGQVLCTEPLPRLQAIGPRAAIWLAILVPRALWQQISAFTSAELACGPALLPARHHADTALRRGALHLARLLQDKNETPDSRCAAASALVAAIAELQSSFDAQIANCPGRTLAQRRSVFLRLQRVRNYMINQCHLDLDIGTLARRASYSPWHFIRAYRAVYGETPHVTLVTQRLERARRLLDRSELAVAEVAFASGFENRCAFSRLFKRRFGVTAASVRAQADRLPIVAA